MHPIPLFNLCRSYIIFFLSITVIMRTVASLTVQWPLAIIYADVFLHGRVELPFRRRWGVAYHNSLPVTKPPSSVHPFRVPHSSRSSTTHHHVFSIYYVTPNSPCQFHINFLLCLSCMSAQLWLSVFLCYVTVSCLTLVLLAADSVTPTNHSKS